MYRMIVTLALLVISWQAQAFFIQGEGHYGARGLTKTNPGARSGSAYQAIHQDLRLMMELRGGDSVSFLSELTLFPSDREALMGDDSRCSETSSEWPECQAILSQDSTSPRYLALTPRFHQAFVQYSGDPCLLEVGRRSRHWGLGAFLDDGSRPFSTDASIFDGITCKINLQRDETLGFSVGYDKITETGSPIDGTGSSDTIVFGPQDNGDDVDQYFFTLTYSERPGQQGSNLTQNVGFYLAWMQGGKRNATNIKIADLYVNLASRSFIFENELMFRLGETSEPSFSLYGGALSSSEDDRFTNDVQSLALAGQFRYILSQSGNFSGPRRFRQGTAESHSLILEYGFSPGDKDGYLTGFNNDGEPNRDRSVPTMAFHRNYKPALILFNGLPVEDGDRVDGVYEPGRVMNARLLALAYEYDSLAYGMFQAKLITAVMDVGMPASVKTEIEEGTRDATFGYGGSQLGYELNLSYQHSLGAGMTVGAAVAGLQPGNAWDRSPTESGSNGLYLESTLMFEF